MKRLLPRLLPPLLPLLLAAAFGHAHAALDATACKPGPANLNPGAVQEASARLAAARSQPGEQQLALADALANLALLSARQNGSPDIATDGNPAPADLLRQSLAIWNAAPPSAALARTLQTRGREFFDSHQCLLSREVLESALRLSSASAGPNAPASVAIAQDLLRVGLAQRDDALVRRLAPTATAALDARTQPLDPQDEQTVLALVDFFYSQPGDSRQDLQQAEHLAQRGLALTTPGTATSARRVLSYRLASIYYAELRYADGEALRIQLANGAPDPFSRKDELGRQRDELIALVRKGDLQAALGMARTLLDQRQQALEASRQALAQAEAAQAQAQQDPAQPSLARSQALRTSAQARARQNAETLRLALVRSYQGEVLHAMGDLDGAAAAYETALAGFAEARTTLWEDRTRTRSDLAILYRTRGDYARALPLQQQVLDELLPLVGEDHPDVKEARAELALLHKLKHG
jgi:tetratricopeptide (TPR) repeat protein